MLTYRTGTGGSARSMAEYLAAAVDVPELAFSNTFGSTAASIEPGRTAAIPAADMHPLIAGLLRIDPGQALSLDQMTHLLAGRRADGKALPMGNRSIAYTDFTFSAPKSFSVALAFAPTVAERAILEECWVTANDKLMDHIGEMIGGGGHVARIRYDHYTSRPTVRLGIDGDTELLTVPSHMPGDMQRHTHNIIPHVSIDDRGKVRALPLDEIRDRLHEWGAIGHAFLATELRARGIAADIDPKTGLSHLPGVPSWASELFGNRARDGERLARKYAASIGLDWDGLDAKARSSLLRSNIKATRRAKDGLVDLKAWEVTAEKAGYRHQSVLDARNVRGVPEEGDRVKTAYSASLPLLQDEWERRSIMDGATPRVMAARGLIRSGIASPKDVDLVTAAYRTEGVMQDGKLTSLIWSREEGRRYAKVTTVLHADHEQEAIGILKAAAADRTGALPAAKIEAAIARSPFDFTSSHGLKQREMILALATAGRAAVGIGSAGSGKTTIAAPIIDAYHAEGWQSVGVTLAWRQTHGLKQAGVGRQPDTDRLTEAGIGQDRAFALHPFLKRAAEGKIDLNKRTLVVVDEIATVGTRQILDLARLQAKHGFKIVGLGDDRQARSVEAGATIDLFRRALGSDQVPEILETVRQKRLDDREIAKLFRDGDAAEALERKHEAGLLHLTPGSYSDAVKAGVDEWERRTQANRGRDDYTIGISVPTNADAHAVGLEMRRRQPLGQQWTIKASDQTAATYDLQLAAGDQVRLFNRVNARYGEHSRGYFGENGTTAKVVAIGEKGITLQRTDGRVGEVAWASLTPKDSDRVRLAYGYALTIDARQGDTLTDHITVLPDGTRGIDAHKIYPADTRNREDSVLIVSQGAEKEALRDMKPIGTPLPDNEAIMANMARNFSRQAGPGLAVDFLDGAMEVFRGSVNAHQAAWHRNTAMLQNERAPDLAHRFEQQHETAASLSLLEAAKVSSIAISNKFIDFLKDERGSVGPRRTFEHRDVQNEFLAALTQEGFLLADAPIMDGEWHRAKVEGDKGLSRSGRYVGYLDGTPAGFIQNFKGPNSDGIRWKSDRPVPAMSEFDRKRFAERRATQEAERQTETDKAGKKAYAIWMSAKEATSHPYLDRKGIKPHGMRIDRDGKLLVPLRDATGFLRNVQTIDPDGEKLFVKNGRKQGLFTMLGAIEDGKPIVIAEGFSTAASVREATHLPVVVAFDSGNLIHVAEALKAAYPQAQFIFAADNDHHLPHNVGKEKAEAAARGVGGIVIAPEFEPGDRATDWNDAAQSRGKQAVRAELAARLAAHGVELPTGQALRDAARETSQAAPAMGRHQVAEQARQMEQERRQTHNQGVER